MNKNSLSTTNTPTPTPHSLGFMMPPEWAPHERTFMEWPLEAALWPGSFDEIIAAFVDAVRKISYFEPVTVIAHPDFASDAKKHVSDIAEIMQLPHDDSWIRDNGPTFVMNTSGDIAGVNWIFNAWGGKYPAQDDNNIAPQILSHYGIKRFDAPFVMEGGSIHVDGEGTLLTTEQCLLNQNRNPGLEQHDIEKLLKQYISYEKAIWLKKGWYGDDTDGHVDNVACFAAPGVILIQTCSDKNDPNYEISEQNLAILRKSTDAKGRSFKIVTIEQPPATYFEGMRLTLSYLNFYFVNSGIILPVFGGECNPYDKAAISTLKEVFPDRRIVTIDGLPLARGGGNIHCLTQQMPKKKPASMSRCE